MPDENIYIVSGSVPVPPCACENLLDKFERAHKGCMAELEQFLKQSENQKFIYETELAFFNINFAQGLENVRRKAQDWCP